MIKVESVYVAASSGDIDRAQHWMNQLVHAGIRCTSTWIESIRTNDGVSNPRNVDRVKRVGYSHENIKAIEDAHLLWFLVPPPTQHTCGAWWESGYAHKAGKVIVASGVDTERSVFCALGHEFRDDLTAFAKICLFAREGAYAP